MAQALYDYFNSVLGSNFDRSRMIDLEASGIPTEDLGALEVMFTEAEV
jgi:hypothetical protein